MIFYFCVFLLMFDINFFVLRYGEIYLVFYVGFLENVIKEVLNGKVKDVSFFMSFF